MKKFINFMGSLMLALIMLVTFPLNAFADELPFTDVKESDWFVNSVLFWYDEGVVKGKTETTFAPNDSITRAEFCMIMYKYIVDACNEGKNIGTEYNPVFSDVKNNAWYTDAVMWCYNADIIKGYGNGVFGTTDTITREQIAVMLEKAQGTFWTDPTTYYQSIDSFADEKDVSSWAYNSMKYAYGGGIINGRANGTEKYLAPKSKASRAEVMVMLTGFDEIY